MTSSPPPALPRRRSRLQTVAVLVIGASAAGLLLRPSNRDPTKAVVLADVVAPGAAAGFNVLLITFDTTKPDHLGCYGYALAHTPTVDSLAAHGVRFDDAVTAVPLTLPSHATILTGRYPPAIGVRVNGTNRLGEEHTTLAERLKAQGYDTAAFVSSFVLDRKFGLDQGFDTYDFRIGVDGRTGVDSLTDERRASEVSTAAIQWLEARARQGTKRPLFLWVHYFDPHHPYNSPLGDTQRYKDRLYDAEIGFADLHLRRLLDTFEKEGLSEKTLIVFVTDHGEGFYDHDEAFHGIFLYETTLRTGLILSSPALFAQGYRVDDRLVGTVDVVPTILALLGLPVPAEVDGKNLLDRQDDPDRALYIETLFPLNNACHPLYGLRRHGDKYLEAPRPEYYDLTRDPGEAHNLYVPTSPAPQALARRLEAVRRAWPEAQSAPLQSISPDDRARLEALGYIGGDTPIADADQADCKDQISIINRMTEVTYLKAQKQYEKAIALATEVMNESTGWYPPIQNLAEMYADTGRPAEAERLLQDFTRQFPSPEAVVRLAALQFCSLNQPEACLQTLEAAELLDAKFGFIYTLRGDVYAAQNRFAEAEQQYHKALEVDPQRAAPTASEGLRRLAARRDGTAP